MQEYTFTLFYSGNKNNRVESILHRNYCLEAKHQLAKYQGTHYCKSRAVSDEKPRVDYDKGAGLYNYKGNPTGLTKKP